MGATKAQRKQAEARRRAALALYIAGNTSYQLVADELATGGEYGPRVTRQQVAKDVEAALDNITPSQGQADHHRKVNTERYQLLLSKLWPLCVPQGDGPPNLQAVDRVVAVMRRIESLWGLLPKEQVFVQNNQTLNVGANDARAALVDKALAALAGYRSAQAAGQPGPGNGVAPTNGLEELGPA